MRSPLTSTPAQARQTRQQLANPEDSLSYELGKAVQELPPLYTRLLAASISLLVFGAIAWAYGSQVDEVAVANGELIASTQVRPVRSLGGGVIKAVKVKEGDRVKKGDILIERDPDLPQAEVDRLAKSTQLIREDLGRLEAERTGSTTKGTSLQDQLLTARLQDFSAKRAAAIAEANRQIAVINEAKVRLTRLQENLANAKINKANAETNLANSKSLLKEANNSLALAETRQKALTTLLIPGAVPRLDYVDAQERVVRAQAEVTTAQDNITNVQNKVTEVHDKITSLEKDIAAQAQAIRQAEQAYQSARNQAERLKSERQSDILTELNKRQEELTTVAGQLESAKKQRQVETITAPVTGTVYSIKATKGPVQAGEELLSILPESEELLVEVKVLNRDIGFIRKGMKAKVKMATFPFQEFGTVEGEVVQVSPNAIADQDLGLVFPTRIKLKKHSIQVQNQEVTFTPGIAATGEIITRRKSVLTFLIEPVTRRFGEAFSVRS
ncbi:HlyD family efflux transporter periplasmic adaptor subunit [Coleofasciculus sp. H7-2]|uniref:HlyD family efflux transporter periplasmic adaptor subunit n=1 Tax=Coleofasciculus sp. H7-2 TaxID=3351545 RepID=UPI00366E4B70